jgi:hypothetical protein
LCGRVSERNVTDDDEEEGKTIRVLVEDNKINQKLVVKEVVAKGERFDIIFMDTRYFPPLPRQGRC